MWTKELKESAVQLAKSKNSNISGSGALNNQLSPEQGQALAVSFKTQVKPHQSNSAEQYWG